jgi:hypothetical protein
MSNFSWRVSLRPSQTESLAGIQPRVGVATPTLGIDANATNSERVPSVPQITLVERNLVTPQKLPQFILKRYFPVVLFLIRDVFFRHSDLRLGDGENGITVLPREFPHRRTLRLNLFRRRAFNLHNHVRLRTRPAKDAKQMNMVLRATDHDRQTIKPVKGAAQVTVHFFAQPPILKKRLPILGGKDRMNDNFTERLRHHVRLDSIPN